MAFTVSSTTITQTGTDTDLSGLSAITGVTTTTLGEATIYNVPYELTINGTLTQRYNEQLIITEDSNSFDNEITVNGTWNWGEDYNKFGVETYRRTLPLMFSNTPTNSYSEAQNASILANSGATLNWKNVEVLGAAQFWVAGATLNWRDVIINRQNLNKNGTIDDSQFRIDANSTVDIDGLKTIGGKFFLLGSGITITKLKNFQPEQMTRGLGLSNGNITLNVNGTNLSVTFIELEDFAGLGNELDFGAWGGGYARFINPKEGTDIKVGGHISGSAGSYGFAEVRGTATVKTELSDGTSVDDIILFHRDNATNADAPFNSELTYFETSTAGQASLDILTGFVEITNGTNTSHSIIKRSATQTDDVYSFDVLSYLHNLSSISVDFKGTGDKKSKAIVSVDSNISETNPITVDAHTEADSLKKVYDGFKRKKVEPANVEFPRKDTLICTINGLDTDFGNVNVDVDDQATNVRDFIRTTGNITAVADNSGMARLTAAAHGFVTGQIVEIQGTTSYNGFKVVTVVDANTFDISDSYVADETGTWQKDVATIKATTLSGDSDRPTIKSNGLIRTLNNATITAGVVDSQGDAYISFNGIANIQSWKLYPTLGDADNDTNKIAEDISSPIDDYRFNYSANQTYYAKVVTSTRIAYPQINISGTGKAEIIFTDEDILSAILADVGLVKAKTDPLLLTDGKVTINDTQNEIIIAAKEEATIAANNTQI